MKRALATIVAAAGALALAPSAAAERVAVVVDDSLDLAAIADRAAVGLLVPGSGEHVSREGALSALVRGAATPALLGGISEGEPLLAVSDEPGTEATVYVALPPAGSGRNDTRYPVAIVGRGYRGLLTSASTRIPGLVSMADVAPTALALEDGRTPPIGWREDGDPVAATRELDRRLTAAHDARDAATATLVVTALVLAAAALVLRSAWLARAVIAAPLVALGLGLALSAAAVASPEAVVAVVAAGTGPLALLVARSARVAAWAFATGLAVYLAVLVASPQTAALAVIGPHPDSGGRFHGVTNLVETMVLVALVAVLAAAPALPGALLAALALVTVGWSEAGADGGGLLVLGAAVATVVLARSERLDRSHAIGAAALVAAGTALFVLVDRLTGGASHVTRSVDSGPAGVLDDIARRLEVSWQAATNNTHTLLFCLLALAALAILTWRGPRTSASVALLAGLAVSLVVNDSPPDVLVTGAIGLAAIVAAARAGAQPLRDPGGARASEGMAGARLPQS